MKLLSIKLFNFRQFYGPQTITFATDSTKNVTLFHAENGVGKTTLLTWMFFRNFMHQRSITARNLLRGLMNQSDSWRY
jgi:DNA repair exonuclease SbcCD ATPase subunit